MKVLISFLFLLMSQWAMASTCHFTKSDATEKLECKNISVLVQNYKSGVIHFNVTFNDQFKMTLEVLNQNQISGFFFNNKRVHKVLTAEDKKYISQITKEIENSHQFSHPELIKFFELLPIHEDLSSLKKAALRAPLQQEQDRDYIMICSFLGKNKTGVYTLDDDDQLYSKRVKIGLKKSQCYGRCGPGCNDDSPVYTQECLNHDVCRRETGENFGPCSDEWWTAANGYLWAPLCNI